MTLKIVARIVAVLALASAVIAAVAALRGSGTEVSPLLRLRDPGGDPARKELLRCRDIGKAALDDAACRRAWADSRRRFLGVDATKKVPAP